jgi:hypothetical protein
MSCDNAIILNFLSEVGELEPARICTISRRQPHEIRRLIYAYTLRAWGLIASESTPELPDATFASSSSTSGAMINHFPFISKSSQLKAFSRYISLGVGNT